MMKNNDLFLKNLLILLIVIIIYTYVRQQKNKVKALNNFNNTQDNSNHLQKTINQLENKIINKLLSVNCNNIHNAGIHKNNLVEFTNGKTYLGPEHNFHQSFNNQYRTELGWRKWWFNNQNVQSKLENQKDQFQPKMRNFFNNQENTKNIYLNT